MARLSLPFPNELDELVYIVRADDQIDMRRPFKQAVLPFLGHAACDGDDEIRVMLLDVLELADFSQDFSFSSLADAAGVEQDNVGHIHVFRTAIPQRFQLAGVALAVGLVHLTSVCQQKVKFIFYDIQCRFSPFP